MARVQPETAQTPVAEALVDRGIAAAKLGRFDEARALFQQAADTDEDCVRAHMGLSQLRFPGDHYLDVLKHIHEALRPRTYLEIGVATGESLKCAGPDTLCIGVDPSPGVPEELKKRAQIFAVPSNAFFAATDVGKLLGGLPLDLGFIDGSHLFEDALDDFIHLERTCGARSTIVMHDCLPIHPVPAARECRSRFWTGDVWRVLPTLARFRPDLTICVIECRPSGLTVVQGLDPASKVLAERREEAIAFGFAQPFEVVNNFEALGIRGIPSHPDAVAQLLAA